MPALLAGASAVHAQSIVPLQAQICNSAHLVDKARLATFLLDAAPVSRKLEDWATANRAGFEDLSPRERMIVDERICALLGDKPPPHCSASDAKSLATARQTLIYMLTGQPRVLQNLAGISEPRQFFATSTAQIRCLKSDAGEPVELAGAKPNRFELKVPVRVRGNADGLHFARTDAAQFKPQEKAAISFSSDKIKKKRTEKFSVVVGYPFPLVDEAGKSAEIVPYFGLARDVAKVNGNTTVSTDLWRFGAVLDYAITANEMTHWFVARPEYLFNDKENSKLGTFNVTYVPVINGRLNDYRYLIRGNDRFISFQPLLDVRLVAGHFLKQGDRSDEDSRDYLRVGGQAGISFSSDIIALPADLTFTQLYLPALTGSGKELHYFKTVLGLGIDKDRLIGVDVVYGRGRKDDLLAKERAWTIGVGMKF